MEQLATTWGRLSTGRKITAVLAAAATAIAIWFLAKTASTPHMALLYAGLDGSTSGEVLAALEAMDVPSEVRGDAIYVPESTRDSVRMALAREGLPSQGQGGFELLEKLNQFSTTSEMFDAAYWRAKEGELARTILATPGVKSARVHIASARTSAFSRSTPPPSAVVTVAMARGDLDAAQAVAMRYLVALAVPRLEPEQVAVIDQAKGVVLKPGAKDEAADLSGSVDEREKAFQSELIDLLEARVGVGNARVVVNFDIDRESETVSERIIDPASRTLITQENSDTTQSDVGASGGAVTVASNLPEGDKGGASHQSRSNRSESSNTARFDLSETKRERQKLSGAIKRLTIAVLINEPAQAAPTGDGAAPPRRTPEELDALKKLVMAAAGFDAARGDVVTIESMAFESLSPAGTEAVNKGIGAWLQSNLLPIMQILIPAIVALILALFVVKPLLTSKGLPPALTAAVALPPAADAQAEGPAPPATPVDDMRRIAIEKKNASTTVLKSWLDEGATA